ncbi:hypothetical protein Tco_1300610 [Tanacetum coccineum]
MGKLASGARQGHPYRSCTLIVAVLGYLLEPFLDVPGVMKHVQSELLSMHPAHPYGDPASKHASGPRENGLSLVGTDIIEPMYQPSDTLSRADLGYLNHSIKSPGCPASVLLSALGTSSLRSTGGMNNESGSGGSGDDGRGGSGGDGSVGAAKHLARRSSAEGGDNGMSGEGGGVVVRHAGGDGGVAADSSVSNGSVSSEWGT